ncbi:MAG: hypothetical protein EA415_12100 [Sphaerobacteraceae bacterium]|nr:MAG: hypothetical protein EA415_12100 [Sphaerobacteraceae bacterium]
MFELIGRDREQSALRSALHRAWSGSGRLALVSGEAGIGKTSLVNAFIESTSSDDVCVLRGACFDFSTTPPYGPWYELMRAYSPSDGFPDVPDFIKDSSALSDLQSQDELFSQMLEFFVNLSRQKPTVLVLEDLHWSDETSLNLLRFIARQLADHRILLIATYRNDEIIRERPLYSMLPHLVREALPARIELRAFTSDEVRQLVPLLYPLSDSDLETTVSYLEQRTGGNPLFILESLRQLELQGNLQQVSGTWELQALDETSVPDLIQQIVEGRLEQVNESTVSVVQTASVVGQQVPVSILDQLLCDDQIADAVDEAANTWLLDVDPTSPQVSFRHALVREAVYECTPYGTRKSLHQKIAEVLIQQAKPDPEIIAWHLRQAGDPRSSEWLIQAGEVSENRFAWHEAVDRYSRAADVINQSVPDHETLAWLMLRIGELLRLADPARANEWLWSAQAHARDGGLRDIFTYAQFAAGQNLCNLGEPTRGLRDIHLALLDAESNDEDASLECSLSFIGPNPAWDMSYSRMIGSYAYWLTAYGRVDESMSIAESAVGNEWKALRTSEARTRYARRATWGARNTFTALAHSYGLRGEPDTSRIAFELALEINRLTDFEPHNVLVSNQALMGHHLPYASDDLLQRSQLVDTIEHWGGVSQGMFTDLYLPGYECLLLWEGRWDELRNIWRENPQPTLFHYWSVATCVRARLARLRGDPDAARNLLSSLLTEGSDTSPDRHVHLIPGEAHRVLADLALDEANTQLAREWMSAHDRWLEWTGAIPGQADGAIRWATIFEQEGDSDAALEQASYAHLLAQEPRQPLSLIGTHRLLGSLLLDQKDLETAEEHVAHSIAIAQACKTPYEEARSRLVQAQIAYVQGNLEAAEEGLSHVGEVATELGAWPMIWQVDRLRRSSNTSPSDGRYGLSGREQEVLALIVEGLTDRQIAEQLFISHRTVMRHVTHILRKLDVGSRTAAAARSVEEKLHLPDS